MVLKSLVVAMTCAASALPSGPLREAARRIETAAATVTASVEARGADAENRAYELARLGHRALGRGYNVGEASEILARMAAWLASREGRDAARTVSGEEGTRRLLELAARRAHPEIGEGVGTRGASNWSDFVVGAAALNPAAPYATSIAAVNRLSR